MAVTGCSGGGRFDGERLARDLASRAGLGSAEAECVIAALEDRFGSPMLSERRPPTADEIRAVEAIAGECRDAEEAAPPG